MYHFCANTCIDIRSYVLIKVISYIILKYIDIHNIAQKDINL